MDTTTVLRAALSPLGAQPIAYRRLRDSDLIGVAYRLGDEWGVGTVDEAAGTADLTGTRRRLVAGTVRRNAVNDALDNHLASLEAAR
jgi:hypothetical protein